MTSQMTITDPMTGQQCSGTIDRTVRSVDAVGEPGAELRQVTIETDDEIELTIAVFWYETGTYFTTIDWQGQQPQEWDEIADYRWIDADGGDAIMFDGLPVKGFAQSR